MNQWLVREISSSSSSSSSYSSSTSNSSIISSSVSASADSISNITGDIVLVTSTTSSNVVEDSQATVPVAGEKRRLESVMIEQADGSTLVCDSQVVDSRSKDRKKTKTNIGGKKIICNPALVILRISENKDQYLVAESHNGKENVLLHCDACLTYLHADTTSVERHLKKKHQLAKNRKDIELGKQIKSREIMSNQLETATQFRQDTVKMLLGCGIPLFRVNKMRNYLQKYSGIRLTDSSNLQSYIPKLLIEELLEIRSEIKGQRLAVIFDGTTKDCECFTVVFRFVTADMTIEHRCVELKLYESSFENYKQLANAVVRAISSIFDHHILDNDIARDNLVCFQRDRAAINLKAMDLVTNHYLLAWNFDCLSHTLCHTGDKLDGVEFARFFSDFNSLFSHSTRAKAYWKHLSGSSYVTYSATRWWSRYESYVYVRKNWDHLSTFILTAVQEGDISETGAYITRMTETVNNTQLFLLCKLQLDVIAIVGKPLVEATYVLEGDGPTSIIAFRILDGVNNWFEQHLNGLTFPGVQEIINTYLDDVYPVQQEQRQTKQIIKINTTNSFKQIVTTARDYFTSRIWDGMSDQMDFYKGAEHFDPYLLSLRRPSANEFLESINQFQYFSDEEKNNIMLEYTDLLASVVNIAPTDDGKYNSIMDFFSSFWKAHRGRFPNTFVVARYLATFPTSSAASERVFSVLKRHLSDQMQGVLEDYIKTSVMLEYNKRN